jgi:adenylate cyclase class 2
MDRIRASLRQLGAHLRGTDRELNQLFDRSNESLRYTDQLLRIRTVEGAAGARVTVKGPASREDNVKVREELEVTVDDPETLRTIFDRLGFALDLEYRKVRETWHLGATEIALDELAFGLYCEIEGPVHEIHRIASALELTDPEARGYPSLTRKYLSEQSIQ